MNALDGSGLTIFDMLAAPFQPDQISWRIGSTNAKQTGGKPTKGKPLAYIDARDLYKRLDEACAACGTTWQCSYTPMGNGSVVANIGIKIDGEWLWRGNGAGHTDVEAEKGMYSDAIKRAGVPWGIAAYLYDIKSGWIDLDEKGGIPEKAYEGLNLLHEKAANGVRWGGRPALKVYQFLEKVVNYFGVSPESRAELWEEIRNSAEFNGMPAEMKRTFKAEYIDRPQQEKAA